MSAARTLVVLVGLCVAATAVALAQRVDRFDPEDWITIRDFRVVEAVTVSNDVAYFGTTEGLERFDTLRDAWRFPLTRADGLPHDRVTSLVVDPTSGDLWIGTPRGLVRFLEFVGEVERVFGPPPGFVDELRIDLREGTVYARISGAWWKGRAGSPVLERSGPPPSSAKGSADVDRLDPSGLPWTDPLYVESSIDRSRIVRLTELDRDQRGDIYVGTAGDNGRRWGAGRLDWQPLQYGLGGPAGGPIVRTDSALWFVPGSRARRGGAEQVALAALAANGVWSYALPRTIPELPIATARAAIGVGDSLFLGSAHGLTRFDGETWKTWNAWTEVLLEGVTSLESDGAFLWVGTERGLVRWNRSDDTIGGVALRGRTVTAIAAAPDAVFVGTTSGLYVGTRDPKDGPGAMPETFTRRESRGSRVHALALRDDRLFVATGVGLGLFDRVDGEWTFVPVTAGRLDAPPRALAIDDRNVWIGTDRGLTRWSPDTDEWTTYGPADGLAGAPVFHLWADRDAVWASTPEGASRFHWRQAPR